MFLSTYPSRPHSHIESENKQEKVFNTSPINTHGLTQPKCSSAAVTPPLPPFDVGFEDSWYRVVTESAPPAVPDVWGHGVGERPWPVLELNEWSICWIVEDPSHKPII